MVIAADLHFLAGQLIAGDFYFLLGADGIFAARIFADDFVKCAECFFGACLIAGNVGISSK